MDRGAWRTTVHGVAKSWTRLSDQHTHTLDGKVSAFVAFWSSTHCFTFWLHLLHSAWPWHSLSPGSFLYETSLSLHEVVVRIKGEKCLVMFSLVQSLSCVRLFVTPWIAAHQASLSITNSWSLLKLMPIESVVPSNHLILCLPLLLLPSIFPSIRVFSNESALCVRWPKDWSFSFNISPSNEYLGLVSFSIDWFDLLTVQETLKSLL